VARSSVACYRWRVAGMAMKERASIALVDDE
jgi:hypothetical protein